MASNNLMGERAVGVVQDVAALLIAGDSKVFEMKSVKCQSLECQTSKIRVVFMAASTQALLQKIELLPPERIAEVVDFVEFLQMKEQAQAFTRQAAQASAPAFASVWDNADDEAYDAL